MERNSFENLRTEKISFILTFDNSVEYRIPFGKLVFFSNWMVLPHCLWAFIVAFENSRASGSLIVLYVYFPFSFPCSPLLELFLTGYLPAVLFLHYVPSLYFSPSLLDSFSFYFPTFFELILLYFNIQQIFALHISNIWQLVSILWLKYLPWYIEWHTHMHMQTVKSFLMWTISGSLLAYVFHVKEVSQESCVFENVSMKKAIVHS